MTFVDPLEGEENALYVMTLPARSCNVCGREIRRRTHRVVIRASWRNEPETLCPGCWRVICQWASRFALQQGVLDGFGAQS